MRNRKGFTLIEMMVVIGVLFVIITLALPNIIRSRINSNEFAAFANLKVIFTGCQNYYNGVYPHEFPLSMSDLTSPNSIPPYIDSYLASGEKQGYLFEYERNSEDSFSLRANPKSSRIGKKYYFVDENGSYRYSTQGPADENSAEFKT